MNAYLISGIYAGLAGLLTFLIYHHFYITPIWFIFPLGAILAMGGGLAVGRSYELIQKSLPSYPWTFIGLTLVIMLILAPAMIIAEFTPAPFGLDGSLAQGYTAGKATMQFVLELGITAVVMGAAAGWVLGHSRGAMIATAIAGLIYAIGPGHNIPFLGNTPANLKGIFLLLLINLVSSFVLMISVRMMGNS